MCFLYITCFCQTGLPHRLRLPKLAPLRCPVSTGFATIVASLEPTKLRRHFSSGSKSRFGCGQGVGESLVNVEGKLPLRAKGVGHGAWMKEGLFVGVLKWTTSKRRTTRPDKPQEDDEIWRRCGEGADEGLGDGELDTG